MKNIHVISTDKPSRLHLAYDKDFYLSVEPFIQLDTKNYKSFNIYITSDEEIKQKELCYCISNNCIVRFSDFGDNQKNYKKIILTTDQDLIKDGVQAIDDEFLEWFVKNPSCEKVELQKWAEDSKEFGTAYSIIFPKEEPKQETLEESNKTTSIRFLEWYRLKKVIYQFHCYHIPNINDKSWEQTVFFGENSYLNADQLFEIFKKENYEKRNP
jgi:hypothetical protein